MRVQLGQKIARLTEGNIMFKRTCSEMTLDLQSLFECQRDVIVEKCEKVNFMDILRSVLEKHDDQLVFRT